MYELQDWAAVQRVYKQTGSKRETAKILGISRNTVKKLLDMKEEPAYSRMVYRSCLDDFKEQDRKYRAWRKKYENSLHMQPLPGKN